MLYVSELKDNIYTRLIGDNSEQVIRNIYLGKQEDIIEEVFWEIQDETDEEIAPILRGENGTELICQSYVRMDELLTTLWLQFEDLWLDDEFESETLSYLITSSFERFPNTWEELQLPLQTGEDQEKNKFLTFKVLWVKKSIVWELEVSIKNENNEKLELNVINQES